MRKKLIGIIVLFLIFLVQQHTVYAIRISPSAIKIDFQPNYEETFTFHTEATENIGIYIEGNLAEYITVEEDNIAKDGTFLVKVKLPDEIETPGKNRVLVGLIEKGRVGGTVAGIASIRTPIDIKVPYPGVYAEITFHVNDLNINETANFVVRINNLGKEDINNAKAEIGIFDSNEVLVENILTQEKKIKANTQENLKVLFDASKHIAGTYKAVAHVTYADKSEDFEDGFKIGTLNIKIINYTRTFFKDKINKFNIEIKSLWNSKIDDIFAEVEVLSNAKEVSSFRTVSVSLEPWEKKTISTFWDMQGLDEGTYDVEINLFYQGQTTELKDAIEIVTKKEELAGFLTMTHLLIAAVLLLIIINIIILVKKSKKWKQ
ncbi:MAG TPA: hypothetical protein QF458_04860 [Candidatus Woesearchaeota archaeon]|jgi:hypothetical protein|nr:hypothetical protein [Candidatus Woesearchaeota archaeon]HJO02224.1 hypothetical protein [Candidatus Woesearchaeota archaeon]